MSLKHIFCIHCSHLIGYFDDFNIPAPPIGTYVCSKCKFSHKNFGSDDIAPSDLRKLLGDDIQLSDNG